MEKSRSAKSDPATYLNLSKAEAARIETLATHLEREIDDAIGLRNFPRLAAFFRTLQDAAKPMESVLAEHRSRLGIGNPPTRHDVAVRGLDRVRTAAKRIKSAAGELRADLERTTPRDFEAGSDVALLTWLRNEALAVKELAHRFAKGVGPGAEPLSPEVDKFFNTAAEFASANARIEAFVAEMRSLLDQAIGFAVEDSERELDAGGLGALVERLRSSELDLKFVVEDLRKFSKKLDLPKGSEPGRRRSRIRTLCLAEIFSGIEKVSMQVGAVNELGGHPNKVDLLFVPAIAKYRRARNIFEFGTYTGRTTYHLTLASEATTVTTFNLPPEQEPRLAPYLTTYYRDNDRAERIRQLYGDSRTFDPAPFAGRFDFIFIDADHSYELVKNDTEKALTMLAPNGMLVWHDYAPKSPGVVQFIEEFSQDRPVFHVRNTCLALWIDGVDAETFEPAPMPPSIEYDMMKERNAVRSAD